MLLLKRRSSSKGHPFVGMSRGLRLKMNERNESTEERDVGMDVH
jgi:hypothetical protein